MPEIINEIGNGYEIRRIRMEDIEGLEQLMGKLCVLTDAEKEQAHVILKKWLKQRSLSPEPVTAVEADLARQLYMGASVLDNLKNLGGLLDT